VVVVEVVEVIVVVKVVATACVVIVKPGGFSDKRPLTATGMVPELKGNSAIP
jgi:hypothetical protein